MYIDLPQCESLVKLLSSYFFVGIWRAQHDFAPTSRTSIPTSTGTKGDEREGIAVFSPLLQYSELLIVDLLQITTSGS